MLTEAQKADQNLQYMLSLFKSAADPDGRPKQHRLFGSNTARLLRPNTTQVWSLTASSGETDTHTHTQCKITSGYHPTGFVYQII